MATVKAVVLKHQKKKDGTYMVKYRLFHEGKTIYIDTGVPSSKSNLDSKGKLKAAFVEAKFAKELTNIRDKIADLNRRGVLSGRNIESLKDLLFQNEEKIDFDFMAYLSLTIDRLKTEGRQSVSYQMTSLRNSIRDYMGGRSILPFDQLDYLFLKGYEKFLLSPRTTVRPTKNGGATKPVHRVGKSKNGLILQMSLIRNVFNRARFEFNDEDLGVIRIKNYPFRKYVIPKRTRSEHRNLPIEKIITIFNVKSESKRVVMARNLFMLSFFLCGMNARDMYSQKLHLTLDGRIGYNRAKTRHGRLDEAFISVFVPDCAKDLIGSAVIASTKYSTHLGLNTAIGYGMREIGKLTGIDKLTFYHARHSFATIARNDCRCSKDDIADALNHVDSEFKITDGYLAKDWRIIDDVQSKVLQFFFNELNKSL